MLGGRGQCCSCTCVCVCSGSCALIPAPFSSAQEGLVLGREAASVRRQGWVSTGNREQPPEMGSREPAFLYGSSGPLCPPLLFCLHPPHLGLQAGPGETHSRGWEPLQPCSLICHFSTLRVQRRCRESGSGRVLPDRGGKGGPGLPPCPNPKLRPSALARRLGKQREVPMETRREARGAGMPALSP